MLRLLLISIPTILIACSSDRPQPVAPAGKAADFGSMFDAFNQAQSESESPADTSSDSTDADDPSQTPQETPADTSQVAVESETETDVDFNIDIVFLNDFDSDKKAWIEEIASQWEMFFYDMDDYVFDNAIELPIHAGSNIRFEEGEVIDDIRIYIDELSEETAGDNHSTVWDEQPYGLGDVVLFRPNGDVPVVGTVLMNENRMEKHREEHNESPHFTEFLWRKTFHHEMGHALGIGPSPAWTRNVHWQDNANAWFMGPNAVREYRLMAPDDDSPGVPLSERSIIKPRKAPHWEPHGPMQWGFFDTYFLQDNGLPNITRTALGAFHDIGWNVNYEMGLPKIPDDILPCWLLGDIGNFHLCPREE